MNWRTPRRSNPDGECAEVASVPGAVLARDSKDRSGPVLAFTPDTWTRFLDQVKEKV